MHRQTETQRPGNDINQKGKGRGEERQEGMVGTGSGEERQEGRRATRTINRFFIYKCLSFAVL